MAMQDQPERSGASDASDSDLPDLPDLPPLGARIRRARLARNTSLRALAVRVGVSASMISQIETGKSQPSVSTLYAISSALGISIQEIFDVAADPGEGPVAAEPTDPPPAGPDASASAGSILDALGSSRGQRVGPIVHPADRAALVLDTGVVWERLGELPPHSVDFLRVTYPPGGKSVSTGGLMRHPGAEFGYLISGELVLVLGFEEIRLRAGDSFSFESSTPHSYRNDGSDPAIGIWFVLDG